MQLSAELWKSLITSIRGDHRKGLPDKRKHPRVQIRARIGLVPVQDGHPAPRRFEVWTRDVSAQGISFTTNQPLCLAQQFLIELPRPRVSALRLLASVRQCRKLADNVYCVGLIYQPLNCHQTETPSVSSASAA
ncbi:MAG: PilZ domain-containing protein [Tepidisphaeraceae bacterium]|jgi:hypothetical protein